MKRLSPALTILVLILAIFTLTNCKTTAPETTDEVTIAVEESTMDQKSAPELSGTEWNIEQIDGQDVVADSSPSVAFLDEDRLAGNASCNRMMGVYEQGEAAGELSIKLGGTTMMMCPEEIMVQEQTLQGLLPKVASYTIDGDTLTLKTEDGKTITASRAVAKAVELTGPEWILDEINGQAAVTAENPASIEFLADGKLAGNASCNRMMGTYEQGEADGELSIELGGTTRMMCPEEVMEQEKNIQELLPQITSYTIDGGTLTLKTDDGKTITARRH